MLALLKLREVEWFQLWLCFSEKRELVSLSFISVGFFIQLVTLRGSGPIHTFVNAPTSTT